MEYDLRYIFISLNSHRENRTQFAKSTGINMLFKEFYNKLPTNEFEYKKFVKGIKKNIDWVFNIDKNNVATKNIGKMKKEGEAVRISLNGRNNKI